MPISKMYPGIAALILACAVSATAHASAFVNGDFETGDFTGWTVTSVRGDAWFVIGNGGSTPLNRNHLLTPFLAGGGAFNAEADQSLGGGTHQLSQTLNLTGGAYTFSFDARAYDQSTARDPFDFGALPYQQYSVRLDGAEVVINITNHDWQHFSLDLTLAGGAHTFTFYEHDEQGVLNAGLDNVSLTGGTPIAAAPEPAAWALMMTGFGLAGAGLRRRARQPATT